MAIANINNISVQGDKNIVIQGANNSTITINTGNEDEIKTFFDAHSAQINTILELLKGRQEPILKQFGEQIYNIQTIQTANFNAPAVAHYHITAGEAKFELNTQDIVTKIFDGLKKSLNVLVITDTANFMGSKAVEWECNKLSTHYSFALEYWKPFGTTETIQDLLQDFSQKNNCKIKVSYVGNGLKSDLHKWKNNRKNFIVLIDALALARPENYAVAQIFDDNDVGGCFLLWDTEQSENAHKAKEDYKQQVFNTLCPNIYQFHEYCADLKNYKGLLQVGIEVHSKAELFRKLTQIIAYTPILTFDDISLNSIQVDKDL